MIIQPNGFHANGMTSASMTFIHVLYAVRSSYRGCEKTFAKAACELHPALLPMALDVIRSKGQKVGGPIHHGGTPSCIFEVDKPGI